VAAALLSTRARGAVASSPRFSNYPFSLGVASGDPSPDGVVLWTRLAPDRASREAECLTWANRCTVQVSLLWLFNEVVQQPLNRRF
jgi:phosphodiesterase/alkaline phosphatase D-like protein